MASQYAEQKNKNEFAYKSSPPAKTSFQEFTSLVSSSGAKDNTAEMKKQNVSNLGDPIASSETEGGVQVQVSVSEETKASS